MKVLALALAMTAAGCAAAPISAGYTADRGSYGASPVAGLDALAPFSSNYMDVLARLGPPTVATALGDGFAFLYEGSAHKSRSIGASFYSLRAGYSWSDAGFSAAAFVFDGNGTLIGLASETRQTDTGAGFAIGTQRSKAADQAVHMLPGAQHRWGRALLRRTPQQLNTPSDLDSGIAGLERRGTTTKVGQRTLESGYMTATALLEMLRTESGF